GLQHPNIVTIYDMGDENGVPYIAMELIDGENLEQLISQRTPIPLSLKIVYTTQACSAFDYAHKRGIVHRDIKPGNIMVNKDGTVKVVDFGIARVLETSKTQTGMRSEEHTSELQSRGHLVCRLLLEKKKKKN